METYSNEDMDYIPIVVDGIGKIHRQVFLLSMREMGFLPSEGYEYTKQAEMI